MVTVENPDNLALAADPLIIALNHNGSFATIFVPAFLIYHRQGRLFSAVSDWMFGRLPLVGWLYRQIDPVYVYNKPSTLTLLNKLRPQNHGGSIIPECLNRLAQGRSIMIFPEGARNKNPLTLLKGRPGIGHLVLGSRRPVLPIGINFPIPRMAIQPAPITIRIGKLMTFPKEIGEYQRLQLESTPGRSGLKSQNKLAHQITHELMLEIARLSGKSYPYPKPCLSE